MSLNHVLTCIILVSLDFHNSHCYFFFFFFFFFFQAEDGIRDTSVTGVQTSALPICASCVVITSRGATTCTTADRAAAMGCGCCIHSRSEERRVGKECRSRWSAYQ